MWIFTRYGFYSVACASGPDGSFDKESVMVRGEARIICRICVTEFPGYPSAILPTARWPPLASEKQFRTSSPSRGSSRLSGKKPPRRHYPAPN